MKARIYRPSKNAMQSGLGLSRQWILEIEPSAPREPEPLMGWTASAETASQVRIKFSSLDKAKAYADEKGYEYTIHGAHERRVRPRNYGDNFRYCIPEEKKKV